ncbi:MAG: DUF4124 domain-containing protein [Halothiobacillaceae bacterium]|nr:DUF4124 domain-containing protein [Halothiobacillaceae bacterium]
MKTLAIAAALLLTASAPAHAVYKCVVNGKTVFSQTPCAEDAEQIELKVVRPTDEQIAQQAQIGQRYDKMSTGYALDRQIQTLEQKIGARRAELDRLRATRDRQLSALRRMKDHANNNLAGATWEGSLSDEMQAINQKFDTDARLLTDEIAALNAEKSALVIEKTKLKSAPEH